MKRSLKILAPDGSCSAESTFKCCWCWGTHWPTIFTNAISFKVLQQFEYLTLVWKCVEIELPTVFFLNNLERFSIVIFVYTKDLLNYSKPAFAIVDQIFHGKHFFAIIWKEIEKNVNREDPIVCCFVSATEKPISLSVFLSLNIYIYIYIYIYIHISL